MTGFFLQRPAGFWEQVDDYVFTNWKFALDGTNPRYNGNRVSVEEGRVDLDLIAPVTPRDLVLIARFSGAAVTDLSPNVTIPGGTVKEPEFVMLKKGNQTIMKQINGNKFVMKAA